VIDVIKFVYDDCAVGEF